MFLAYVKVGDLLRDGNVKDLVQAVNMNDLSFQGWYLSDNNMCDYFQADVNICARFKVGVCMSDIF